MRSAPNRELPAPPGTQHGEAGRERPLRLVIPEDRERMGGKRAGPPRASGRSEFTGNLVHVGDHQQQTLRRGERRCECACLKRAVDCPGGAALGLCISITGNRSPDVLVLLLTIDQPIPPSANWSDRIDCDDFTQAMRHRGGCFIPSSRAVFGLMFVPFGATIPASFLSGGTRKHSGRHHRRK